MTLSLSFTAAELATLRSAAARRPLDTPAGLNAAFGNPRPRPGRATLYGADLTWARANIVPVTLPVSLPGLRGGNTTDVHRVLAPVLPIVFRQLVRLGLLHSLQAWSGCWVYRQIAGRVNLSTHSYGAAIDLNAAQNQQGTAGHMDPLLIQALEAMGFVWGGRWSPTRRDPMHVQWTLPERGTVVPSWQDAALKAKPAAAVQPVLTPVAPAAPVITRLDDLTDQELWLDGLHIGKIEAASLGGGKVQVRTK